MTSTSNRRLSNVPRLRRCHFVSLLSFRRPQRPHSQPRFVYASVLNVSGAVLTAGKALTLRENVPLDVLLLVRRGGLRKRSDGCHQEEAGDRGRRRLRQDLSAHRLQQGSVPRGVRADRVRELCRGHRGRRQAGGAGAVGHRRTGGLRPPPAAVLPGHRRHPHVLLRGLARLAGEHPREVDARGEALLPERADHPRRQQEGPAQRPEHDQRAEEDEAGAGEAAGRAFDGREDQRVRVSRVLGEEQGGRAGGVRERHACRAPSEEEEEAPLQSALSGRGPRGCCMSRAIVINPFSLSFRSV